MDCHDYHLLSYSVDCVEGTIRMDLGWPYDDSKTGKQIIFSGVAGYEFKDALGSLLFEIEEKELFEFLASKEGQFIESYRIWGIPKFWCKDLESTIRQLDGKKAWLISSSVGFDGYIIGAKMEEQSQAGDETASSSAAHDLSSESWQKVDE